MLIISDLVDELDTYLDKKSVAKIFQAYLLSADAHKDQQRKTGEPYIIHPVAVARILATMQSDSNTIIAAILHDVIEDTKITKTQIEQEFGPVVANMVDGVSKLSNIQHKSKKQAQAANVRNLMLSMTSDIRIIIIKIADRLHNMRTLFAMSPEKKRQVSQETLEFYIPLAERVGMHEIKKELESLVFKNLHPWRHRVLKKALQVTRDEMLTSNKNLKKKIKILLKKLNINATLHYREKSLFSIYFKMKNRGLKFSNIKDLYALRIVVDSRQDCYQTLGIVHNMYKPVLGKFKDYIAIPKSNGYQSLHTVLFIGKNKKIEVQISTKKMNRVSEFGIASHWQHKSDSFINKNSVSEKWLLHVSQLNETSQSSEDFFKNIKSDLLQDTIFLFTPDGDIKELPRGATALDFAYAVHTEVGQHCFDAIVNNSPVLHLGQTLRNGQTVKIITKPEVSPTNNWLNMVTTGKAISNINHYIRKIQKKDAIRLGMNILEPLLLKNNLSFVKLENSKALLDKLNVGSWETLYKYIGLGKKDASKVIELLKVADTINQKRFNSFLKKLTRSSSIKTSNICISGMEGKTIEFSKCCLPLPGDKIFGYFNVGSGLVVHTSDCKTLSKFKRKLLPLSWHEDAKKAWFVSEISLRAPNKPKVLSQITTAISNHDVNITSIQIDDKISERITIKLEVKNRKHLANIIKTLRKLESITKIMRTKGDKSD